MHSVAPSRHCFSLSSPSPLSYLSLPLYSLSPLPTTPLQTINYQIKYHTEKLQNLKMSSGAKRDLAIKKRGSSAYQAAMADAEVRNETPGIRNRRPQSSVVVCCHTGTTEIFFFFLRLFTID
jgi:hypothetical protein